MTVSRLAHARKAVRPALKGRLMLSGVPGSGKTRTGLIVARELAEGGQVLGIDTEKESMLTYADDFDFIHLPWRPPFDPAELTAVLREASGQFAVVFVDSFTHFWRGEGGVLDVAGGKFTGWKEARPLHEALVNSILECDSHVLLGVRSKIGHSQEMEGGRQVVKKLGMEDQQDDNLAFEMNVALELGMDHTATVSKSRTTALPVGRAYGVDRTVEMARTYGEWLKGGQQPVDHETAEAILARLNALPEADRYRSRCKHEFAGAFGRPEQLHESVLEAADAMLARFEADAHKNPTQEGGDDDADPDGSPAPQGPSHNGGLPETGQPAGADSRQVGQAASELPAAQVSDGPGDHSSPAAPGPDATLSAARLAGPPFAAGEGPPATGAADTQGGPTGGGTTSAPDQTPDGAQPVGAASTTPQEPAKPKARRASPKSPGEALHRQLGAMGFDPDIHGELIFAESGGKTVHASELSDGQRAMVITRAEAIQAGRYTIDQLHQICADYRTDHLDSQLEASLEAQRAKAGEAAVADFDARTQARAS